MVPGTDPVLVALDRLAHELDPAADPLDRLLAARATAAEALELDCSELADRLAARLRAAPLAARLERACRR